MAVQVLVQAFKSFLFFFVGIWRRALCCFRRRRRMSCDSIPLTAVGVVPNYAGPSGSGGEADNWGAWDEGTGMYKPNSVQEHIEMYRQQTMAAQQPPGDSSSEEVHEDFFRDMIPRITRQTKVFIDGDGDEDEDSGASSGLFLAPRPVGDELGVWEDTRGWEEGALPDLDPQAIIREKRRRERERRMWEQRQRKQEKVMRPPSLGAKIS